MFFQKNILSLGCLNYSAMDIENKDNFFTDLTGITCRNENHILNYLIDTHEDSVLLCDKQNFAVKCANQTAKQFFRYQQTIIGDSVFKVLPFDVEDSKIEKIQNLSVENPYLEYDFTSENKDTYHLRVSLFKNELLFVVKRTTLKLENIGERGFKLLFDNMSSAFMYAKAIMGNKHRIVDFQILDINPIFESVFEVKKSSIVGKNISQTWLPNKDTLIKILARPARIGTSNDNNYYNSLTQTTYQVCTSIPYRGYCVAVFNDLKTEMMIRNDLIVKNEISKAFALGHNVSLYNAVLELVLKNTGSPTGYIGYFSRKGDIVCLARKDETLPTITDEHGFERVMVSPDYTSFKAQYSLEQEIDTNILGHKVVLATPIISEENNVIGIICTSDCPTGYSEKEMNYIKSLATYISPFMLSEIKERNYKRDLKEAKEKAEESERLKSLFLGNISHEIRTPLNSIMGFSKLLSHYDFDEKNAKFMEMINLGCNQLLSVVNDIKDVAKLQTKQTKLNPMPLNLNHLIDKVYSELIGEATIKNIYLMVEKGLDDKAANIIGDKPKLERILRSIVSNGIKFTETGGVKLGYSMSNGNLLFTISDTGIGIRKEMHSIIFTSFMQDENVLERKYSGVGVGLTISKGFVDLMGGEIWLESKPGLGTTFFIKLKYQPANNGK